MVRIGIAVAWAGGRELDLRQPSKFKQEKSKTGGVHKKIKIYKKELLHVKTRTKLVFFQLCIL